MNYFFLLSAAFFPFLPIGFTRRRLKCRARKEGISSFLFAFCSCQYCSRSGTFTLEEKLILVFKFFWHFGRGSHFGPWEPPSHRSRPQLSNPLIWFPEASVQTGNGPSSEIWDQTLPSSPLSSWDPDNTRWSVCHPWMSEPRLHGQSSELLGFESPKAFHLCLLLLEVVAASCLY